MITQNKEIRIGIFKAGSFILTNGVFCFYGNMVACLLINASCYHNNEVSHY